MSDLIEVFVPGATSLDPKDLVQEITDKDYPPVVELKRVTHSMYPVSWLDSKDNQLDGLFTGDPTAYGDNTYWVGKPIEVTVEHPTEVPDENKNAQIAKLEAELAVLKGEV